LLADAKDPPRVAELWKQVPKLLRPDTRLIAAHARALLVAGETRKVEPLLRKALRKQWADPLVLIYGELPEPAPAKLLQQAEKWLHDQPESAALLQTAGRLCVSNELWGKARSYYESAAAIEPSPQLWHELGQLMLNMGEQEAAFAAFQQGLTQGYGDARVPRLASDSMGDPEVDGENAAPLAGS
jgi:HemY protein